jgi:hypothetical protein
MYNVLKARVSVHTRLMRVQIVDQNGTNHSPYHRLEGNKPALLRKWTGVRDN